MVNIAFSWDDGAPEDLKLMKLLVRYEIPAMFFIPASNPERKTMSKEEVRRLYNERFEIGSHTFSHIYLTKVSYEKAEDEIVKGKEYLEQITGMHIPHFCLPGGLYNPGLTEILRKYCVSARTADTGALNYIKTFLVKPTFHFYNRGVRSLIYNGLKNKSVIFELSLKHTFTMNYFDAINKILSDLGNMDKDFNVIIWGHSWELEKQGLWQQFEQLIRFLKAADNITVKGYSQMLEM
ncbi:MAG: polysaccharide deacetylase family protein [Bacteroidota bacterium]